MGTILLLLLFFTVPPTTPPTTAPMTTSTMTAMVMMPLRLRQKDARGLGVEGGYAGELNFSPESFSAIPGARGRVSGAGRGVCGGGLRAEGVRRGGCWRRSTLYPSYIRLVSSRRCKKARGCAHLQLCASRSGCFVQQILVIGRHGLLDWSTSERWSVA